MCSLGLPHIHGVAWIDPEWLSEFGIFGKLADQPEKTAELADILVSCSVTTDDEKLNDNVKLVQSTVIQSPAESMAHHADLASQSYLQSIL